MFTARIVSSHRHVPGHIRIAQQVHADLGRVVQVLNRSARTLVAVDAGNAEYPGLSRTPSNTTWRRGHQTPSPNTWARNPWAVRLPSCCASLHSSSASFRQEIQVFQCAQLIRWLPQSMPPLPANCWTSLAIKSGGRKCRGGAARVSVFISVQHALFGQADQLLSKWLQLLPQRHFHEHTHLYGKTAFSG